MIELELREKHLEKGAKMVPFAGYNMPLQYTGVTDEHNAVRNNGGVFDVSHMGEFIVKGSGALDLIQKVTSNDAAKLFPGKIQYSCLPNGQGGIVDDLLVYMMEEDHYMLVVNASNMDKDWDWISGHNSFGAELENASHDISLLAVQGPNVAEILQPLTDVNLSEMKYYTFEKGTIGGVNDVIISATGYTGAGGFELYVANKDAAALWDAIFAEGEAKGLKPAGLAARDTLRLEMGFCLYGNDIDDTTSPIEAGLGWITKFTKDFIDREYLENQKAEGVTRKLVAFELTERGIPRKDYPIVDDEGNNIGRVTSGTMSPSTGKAIGLGYVTKELGKVESEINIEIRNKPVRARVVKLPFYTAQ